MQPVAKRHRRRGDRGAAPVLLPTFFVATAACVLAVVALDRIQSDLADAAAIVLVAVCAGLLLALIRRMVAEAAPDDDDRPDDPGEGSR